MQKPENILKISNVPQFWQKTIFWLVVGISSILAVNFLITRPDQTLLLVGLALISLSIAKNLTTKQFNSSKNDHYSVPDTTL